MQNNHRIIVRWLWVGVIMLTIQVLLGGITRLTGSGLSITEWQPIIGMIPPLNDSEWNIAFEKYKQIGQYKFLNQDFTISNFKFIFFWEWFHRNWAHFISFTFLIPFVYFLYKKMITKDMIPKLIGLFLLGIGQGVIGKIMVASGLNDEDLYVNHIKLAIHFISAMVLIAFNCWFAFSLQFSSKDKIENKPLRNFSLVILILLGIQMIYGAFMAGLKAATVAPTWPSINGDYFPATLLNESLSNHPINVHFIHRMLAYTLFITIIIWTMKLHKHFSSPTLNRYKYLPIMLAFLQMVFGIAAVILSTHLARNSFGPFEIMAQVHQLIAMILMMSVLVVLYLIDGKKLNPQF